MTKVRDDLRLRFEYYLQTLTKDGKVPLTLVRDGKEMTIQLPVTVKDDELIRPLLGTYPSLLHLRADGLLRRVGRVRQHPRSAQLRSPSPSRRSAARWPPVAVTGSPSPARNWS